MGKEKKLDEKSLEEAREIEQTKTIMEEAKAEAKKIEIQNLVDKRHYLEFMMLINMIHHLCKHGVERINEEGKEECLPYDHAAEQYLTLIKDQSESIMSGIAKGIYDINYFLNPQEESDSIHRKWEIMWEEKKSGVDISAMDDALSKLSILVRQYALQVPANVTIVSLLLKVPYTREIVADLIKVSKNKVTTLGDSTSEEDFAKRLFSLRSYGNDDPDYKETLIQTFFSGNNVSNGLKKKCIDYYVENGLYQRYTAAFIKNVLEMREVRDNVGMGQALVNAFHRKNEDLIKHIIHTYESWQYGTPIRMTDKEGKSTGKYKCFAHFAYEYGMTEISKTLLQSEYFGHSYYNESLSNDEINYNLAFSFFKTVMENKNYKLGSEIMINYIGSRDRGEYTTRFIKEATAIIFQLKRANTTNIIEQYSEKLLEYYPVINNPDAMEALSEMMVRDPRDIKRQGQLLCNVLNCATETLKSSMTAASLVVPGRVKAAPNNKSSQQGQ